LRYYDRVYGCTAPAHPEGGPPAQHHPCVHTPECLSRRHGPQLCVPGRRADAVVGHLEQGCARSIKRLSGPVTAQLSTHHTHLLPNLSRGTAVAGKGTCEHTDTARLNKYTNLSIGAQISEAGKCVSTVLRYTRTAGV
jgi:hypothetical protein